MTLAPTNKFGIEIELIGLNRSQAANVVGQAIGGTVRYVGRSYDTYEVTTSVGTWSCVTDGSVRGSGSGTEVVSPPLYYKDMDKLQTVVRALKDAGARVNRSCGIHVHVNASRMTPKAVKSLSKMVYAKEELMFKSFGTLGNRQRSYSRPMSSTFVTEINGIRRPSRNSLKRRWYEARTDYEADRRSRSRYDNSRYYAFNLHALYYRGTVEFRYFNGSIHAGKIKAYVQFCLALRNKAMVVNSASSTRRVFNTTTAKYDMRTWLLSLGMVGEEFKTARHHLLKRLTGDSAYRSGRPQSA